MNMYKILSSGMIAVSVIAILAGCSGRTILHGHNSTGHTLVGTNVETNPTVSQKISVWFIKPDTEGVRLYAVSRANESENPSRSSLSTAVTELLSGPTRQETMQGLATEIPRGTLLLGIKETGNDVDLNLSRRFASEGGTASFMMRLMQLKKTVADVAMGKKVYLDIEGERLNETMGDGLEVHQPIN